MKFEFIQAHQDQFPVHRMCSVLEVSASGYYAWQARPLSGRAQANRKLVTEIRDIHAQSRQTYGSPRVYAELMARGFSASKNRVARLMRKENIHSRRTKKRKVTTDSRHSYPIAPNLLQRDFQAASPNEKWLGDITFIPTGEGWLYLAVILDAYSRKVVGWQVEEHLETSLVTEALKQARQRRGHAPGLLHHSDRGVQYASSACKALLAKYQITASMSRKGNCYDNAMAESFFATLKTEAFEAGIPATKAQAKQQVFVYIEGFYNTRRFHSALGYHSPVEFENQFS